MMTLIDRDQLAEYTRPRLGADPTSPDGIAEALRAELWARGHSTRRSLRERVQQVCNHFGRTEREAVEPILDELTARGDLSDGPGGRLAIAPLRLVRLAAGSHAVFGTLPSVRLQAFLGAATLTPGIVRRVYGVEGSALESTLRELGGILLDANRWSGLDRTPTAGPEWLAELDHWLSQAQQSGETLQAGIAQNWQAYQPGAGASHNRSWRSGQAGRLWRGWHEHGYYRFVWTAGTSPVSGGLRLSQDDAYRCCFALDRVAGILPCWPVLRQEGVCLSLRDRLPRAEYRFLCTLGEYVPQEGLPAFRFDTAAWDQVQQLANRLGVVFEEVRP